MRPQSRVIDRIRNYENVSGDVVGRGSTMPLFRSVSRRPGDSCPSPCAPKRNRAAMTLQEMNFDLWCQEDASICRRIAATNACRRTNSEFEAYAPRSRNTKFNICRGKHNESSIDRDILHNDPVGQSDPAVGAAGQSGRAAAPAAKQCGEFDSRSRRRHSRHATRHPLHQRPHRLIQPKSAPGGPATPQAADAARADGCA